jgi:hypothetical protein
MTLALFVPQATSRQIATTKAASVNAEMVAEAFFK